MIFIWIIFSLVLATIYRAYAILPHTKPNGVRVRRRSDATCHLAIFLGSGGHTSEALLLLSSLDFARYTPRTYVVSQGDTLSVQRVYAFESSINDNSSSKVAGGLFTILEIPRARRVHQSLLMAIPTAISSLLACIYHLCIRPMVTRQPFGDVLIVNGPGTCVMLCAAAYLSRIYFIPSPRLIYVESFARVNSLSLSGRLLRPFVDRFVVQWPQSLKAGQRGDFRGWLV